MIDLKKLRQFLIDGNKSTYAAGDTAKRTIESDKSTTMIFESGDWKLHDNYFGGEPYGGREVVFFQDQPVYMMVYYGLVDESVTDFKAVYGFLQKSLLLMPENHPYRGPREYTEGDFEYKNSYIGEIDYFSGEEIIYQNDQEIYRAKYIGGLVDQRKE